VKTIYRLCFSPATEVIIIPKQEPKSGIYTGIVYTEYATLAERIEDFIPDHVVAGNYSNNMTKKEMLTKARIIENCAKNLVEACKSIQK
jgi:hypothetical protein